MQITVIQEKIHDIRGHKVMLDVDLAGLYHVETKALNQAVKRNLNRFPEDFMFRLTHEEWDSLRSQIVTSSWGGSRYLPYAFTEHGVTMLASVLRSPQAIAMNITIVRAFIALREIALHYGELAARIEELERQYNKQFTDIYEVLRLLLAEKRKAEDSAPGS